MVGEVAKLACRLQSEGTAELVSHVEAAAPGVVFMKTRQRGAGLMQLVVRVWRELTEEEARSGYARARCSNAG